MLGGQTLSLVPLASGANYTMLGADIHSWANQTANLSFTLSAEQPHKDNQYLYLDSIVFSPEAVPEPSGIALFSLGALFLSFFRHRNSSR
jgi:PEP-CTERM motif